MFILTKSATLFRLGTSQRTANEIHCRKKQIKTQSRYPDNFLTQQQQKLGLQI